MSDASTLSNAGLERLDAVLRDVERPVLIEKSVKFIGGEARAGRRLVSFPRDALGAGPSRHLRKIARDLGAPDAGFAALDQLQSQARSVHLGVEPEGAGDVLKIYLEFPSGIDGQRELRFLALKWVDAGQWVHSLYHAPQPRTPDAMRADMMGSTDPRTAQIVERLLAQYPAALLEVTEPQTRRRSWDVNFSQSELRIETVAPVLSQLSDELAAYITSIPQSRFGHLALGHARDGRGFVTLYHGVKRLHAGEGLS